MALNLGTSGDFAPYVKYNSKAGRWYKKEGANEVEVSNPTFIADFENIKTGWFLYAEGQAPSIVFDPSLSVQAPRPSEKHRRGFKLTLFSQTSFNGLVEFTSASMHVCNAINELYAQYEAEKEKYPGQFPVISSTGSAPQKDKLGTNYKPLLSIIKWTATDVFNGSNVIPITPSGQTGGVTPIVQKQAVSSEF